MQRPRGAFSLRSLFKCYLAQGGLEGSKALWELDNRFVSIAETDYGKFHKRTQQDFREAVERVHRAKAEMTTEDYEEISRAHGFYYIPFSLILDTVLGINVAMALMYDWAHCYVVDGLADAEFCMLFRALSEVKADSKLAEFAEYASTFKFPKCRGGSFLTHLFTKSKIASMLKKEGGWGGTASEFLTIAPVLLRYLTNVVMKRGVLFPMVMSMIAVLDVVIMLQGVKCCCVDPADLKRAIKKTY